MATETDIGFVADPTATHTSRPHTPSKMRALAADLSPAQSTAPGLSSLSQVNPSRIYSARGPATDEAYPGWLRVLIVGTAAVAFWAALVFGAGYAVNVILAVWPG